MRAAGNDPAPGQRAVRARTRLHGDGSMNAIAALEGEAFLQRLPHGGGEGTAS